MEKPNEGKNEIMATISYGCISFINHQVELDISPWRMGLFEKIVLLIIVCMILYAIAFFPLFYKIMALVVLLIML